LSNLAIMYARNFALLLQQQPGAALVSGSSAKLLYLVLVTPAFISNVVWRMVFKSFGELNLSSWASVAGTAKPLVYMSWVVVIYCQTLCVGLTFHMPSAVPQQSAVGSQCTEAKLICNL